MVPKITVTGTAQTVARLEHIGQKVEDRSRKVMHRGADRIVKNAKLNAPVDLHNLEESIKKEVSYTGSRGRLVIHIVAGGSVNGVNVDQYILKVHENYEAMNPGPGTLAKRAANPGRYVGGKFLERALEEERKRLEAQMLIAIEQELRL